MSKPYGEEYMRIKYEVSYQGDCLTDCPNGKSPMVASIACTKCKFHVSRDRGRQIVECDFKTFSEEVKTNKWATTLW